VTNIPGDKKVAVEDMDNPFNSGDAVYGNNVGKGAEEDKLKLATLVGSRICHDLISPIGAVQNGVELLGLSHDLGGPEYELINDSILGASSRARFFRIVYGVASEQMLGRTEIASVLHDCAQGRRISINWDISEPQPRALVRLAFLSIQVCETAMPTGGIVTISLEDETWTVIAQSSRINTSGPLWDDVQKVPDLKNLTPAQVQFALMPLAAQSLTRKVTMTRNADDMISLTF
jgi:histidine phosphotransferase ChpT